jgi:hypothetical protein
VAKLPTPIFNFLKFNVRFVKKKFGRNTKENLKIRTNFKNYKFCMHSRSSLTTFVIDSFFCSVCSRDGNNSIEKMFLENLEKNLEKRIPA